MIQKCMNIMLYQLIKVYLILLKEWILIKIAKYQIFMSQPINPAFSADILEQKYKKALKEISKLITTNRGLKDSLDKASSQYNRKIDEIALKYNDLEKKNQDFTKEKETLSSLLEETHENNSQIMKQRKILQRQIGYLNDVISEQNKELKKEHFMQDEKALASLLRTYEQKEGAMERNRNQQQQTIFILKQKIQSLESAYLQEKAQKEDLEGKFNQLFLQMSKYKELNSTLMIQNQRILHQQFSKENSTFQKEKQMELLANQFRRQIKNLKNVKDENPSYHEIIAHQNYQEIMNEKNDLIVQINELKSQLQREKQRDRQIFQLQEKLKYTQHKASQGMEEINVLKSKIVVLEAKQFLEEAGEDFSQRQFQQKINMGISQLNPSNSIKNNDDASHFHLLKSFIVDLQQKNQKINTEKKALSKKYKSLKSKFTVNAENFLLMQEQNKILKGKVEGFLRLSQKFQYQLERNLINNEEQIAQITQISHNIFTKNSQKLKENIFILNEQLQIQNKKAQRVEKSLKQEIETLKLQLGSAYIKQKEATDKLDQENEVISLYKVKCKEAQKKLNSLQEEFSENESKIVRYQSLLSQQQRKNQTLIKQKQQLTAQIKQLTEDIDKKQIKIFQLANKKDSNFQSESKRNDENKRLKDNVQQLTRQLSRITGELSEKRRKEQHQFQQIDKLTRRNKDLEENMLVMKRNLRQIQEDKETYKLKYLKYQKMVENMAKYEQEIMGKSDQINDFRRQILILENQLKKLKTELEKQRSQHQVLKKQVSNMKIINLELNQKMKMQHEMKHLQNRKIMQNQSEQINELKAQLREEKTKTFKQANELNTVKFQNNKIKEKLDKNQRKDFKAQEQLILLKREIPSLKAQNQSMKNQLHNHRSSIHNFNQQLQERNFASNQEISGLKIKLQMTEDSRKDLIKELTSLKGCVVEIEPYLMKLKKKSNVSWEEQFFINNLSQTTYKLNKLFQFYNTSEQTSLHSTKKSQNSTLKFPSKAIQESTTTFSKSQHFKSNMNSLNQSQHQMKVIPETNISLNGRNQVHRYPSKNVTADAIYRYK